MEKRLLLSILITTYNRSHFLDQLLQSLYDNNCVRSDIEIIVLNNGSEDETDIVLQKYKKLLTNMRVYREKTTLEFTGGYFLLSSLAKGEYVWFIGDDDYLLQKIDKTLLKYLKLRNIDIALLNMDFYLQETPFSSRYIVSQRKNWFKKDENFIYENYVNFFRDVNDPCALLTQISVCVCKRNIFKRFCNRESLHKYDKSNSHHVYIYMSVLRRSKNILYINDKMMCLRVGECSVSFLSLEGRKQRIMIGAIYFLSMIRDVFNEKWIEYKVKKILLRYDVMVIIIGAKLKLKDAGLQYYLEIFNMLKYEYKWIPFFWIGILPAILIPSIVYKMAYKCYKFFKNFTSDVF